MIAFVLAIAPLLVILAGITIFKQSGLRMAFVGWIASVLLATTYFHTSLPVALVATVIGFIKSFGVSVSVVATMYMIFLMGSVGALEVISDRIKRAVVGAENQALYVGIGFGSFLTSLGVVTPSLFPPLLVVMGFTPFAAVAIAVLGYNATTSFALLSIPVTLPAELFKFSAVAFAYKISLFLPVVSIGLAFAMLWFIGGRSSMRRGAVPAVIVGLAVALACLAFTAIDQATGREYVPVRVVGAFAGLIGMGALQLYHVWDRRRRPPEATANGAQAPAGRMPMWRAVSPWIILTILAVIISIPACERFLAALPGTLETMTFYTNQIVDLNILSAIYTWIAASIVLALPFLRPTRSELGQTTRTWLQRAWGPFLAYAVYFCIAYVMQFSAMEVANGELVKSAFFEHYNMNVIVGATLASLFGAAYIVVGAWLGLFGAVVGGSETSSNVMFYPIQQKAAATIGLADKAFMTLFGSHAVAGGVASAITPAKVNNAVATIQAGTEVESAVMRKLLVVALILTLATGLMAALFIRLAL